jgi:HAD superfamily hydrolase (TIGR01490 family)
MSETGRDKSGKQGIGGSSGRLVVFDLDGTLIRGQSQRLLLKHLRRSGRIGTAFYVRLLLWFVLYRVGVMKRPEKIMHYAFSFLKGRDAGEFYRIVETFAEEVIVPLVLEPARRWIEEHRANGDEMLLLSNSLEPLVGRVAKHLGIRNHIATRLELLGGALTGRLHGSPVYGQAKADSVTAFAAENNLSLEGSVAYCDHDSDLPLLRLVSRPVAVNPVPRLLQEARLRGWHILTL